MKFLFLCTCGLLFSIMVYSQTLKLTGGVNVSKGDINTDILREVIQQKQEEVFSRLFQNIIVKYFSDHKGAPKNGINNFPTYYSLYSLMTDLTIGKSKTTISKAVINSAAELAFIYSFVIYYQNLQRDNEVASLKNNSHFVILKDSVNDIYQSNSIRNVKLADNSTKEYKRIETKPVEAKYRENPSVQLNMYMEAAYDVLAKSEIVQSKFYFKRPITSTDISIWYRETGYINDSINKNKEFKNVIGRNDTLTHLRDQMKRKCILKNFLEYNGSDSLVKVISRLRKNELGLTKIEGSEIDSIKLTLLHYASNSESAFSQNVVSVLLRLIIENIQVVKATDTTDIGQVYVDVESLILSLDKEFVQKNKRSSFASGAFFINPRLFFTIGISNGFFLNKNNTLNKIDDLPAPLKNISVAAEKIGFRVKLWDWGYTRSFSPGEVFKAHGTNYIWKQPQKKPLISSLYYNIYGSGLLYNVMNLKTNSNFNYGYVATNIGFIFFNGLETSIGIGAVYQDGLNARNSFFKFDFDIPIIDYISALSRGKNK